MLELGKIQNLKIARKTSVGCYLFPENAPSEEVLLPTAQVPKGAEPGSEVEVFIYKDSSDRIIATTKRPLITMGALAVLQVVDITPIGAFLDWGLEKDLLLPFKEQSANVEKGRKYLVGLYIDKSDRLCATMNIYKLLSNQSPYKENDKVKGVLYLIKRDIGAFIAVDNQYHGLIPIKELYEKLKYGEEIEARVTKVRDDGKLELAIRDKGYKQMDKDVEMIYQKLMQNNGFLNINDNTEPDTIKEELNMSKRAFKRAVGRLLKEGKVKITDEGIELL